MIVGFDFIRKKYEAVGRPTSYVFPPSRYGKVNRVTIA